MQLHTIMCMYWGVEYGLDIPIAHSMQIKLIKNM
jgi:hypothetical protein